MSTCGSLKKNASTGWIKDTARVCYANHEAAAIVAESLDHFDRQRYLIDSYVVMPNHVHVLFKPLGEHSLSGYFALVEIIHRKRTKSENESRGSAVDARKLRHNCPGRRTFARVPGVHCAKSQKGTADAKTDFILDRRDGLVIDGEFGSQAASLTGPSGCQPGVVLDEQDARQPSEAGSFTSDTATANRALGREQLLRAKKFGFSDRQLAVANDATGTEIRATRKSLGIIPTYRLVDTCAAEFEAYTPYYYSTYGDENERRESDKRKIMILGGGPNRIGQGIEFDYCCVHAAFALRELGFETIMVNSNPETVSTDYDTSDKLYFEPLTLEDVLNIYDQEQPEGVFVQFGGQTPLNLASGLEAAGVPILGTPTESIETAEDRKLFAAMLDKLGLAPNAKWFGNER